MPPQLSDDEGSEASAGGDKTISAAKATSKVSSAKEETLMVESDDDNEEDDDDDIAEDEYVVEAIMSHVIDEDGVLRFEVKWEGFDKKADRTWEPIENLETAPKILEAYLAKFGGKEALMEAWEEKKASKGKKRGRASTGGETNETKRGKKNGVHPTDSDAPASFRRAEFKPPSGNWEEAVVGIDACEGTEGSIVVYLTWKGGEKTQHPLHQVYKRCPQKMLKFYESHLVFKKNDEETIQ